MKERYLWLSRPGHAHGWTGEPGAPAEVVVFHFPSLPAPLERRIPSNDVLGIRLPQGQEDRLRLLAGQMERYWKRPAPAVHISPA